MKPIDPVDEHERGRLYTNASIESNISHQNENADIIYSPLCKCFILLNTKDVLKNVHPVLFYTIKVAPKGTVQKKPFHIMNVANLDIQKYALDPIGKIFSPYYY